MKSRNIVVLKIIVLLLLMNPIPLGAQLLAEKTNLLYWATTSPNIGLEISIGRKWTLDMSAGYNPWKWNEKASFRHWTVQPGVRYWTCNAFEGHFFGLYGSYAKYNVGNLSFIPAMKDYVYKGNMFGGGISYGYHFPLKGRWGLELEIGVGYLYMEYDKHICRTCSEKIKSGTRDYWGPTKIGISFVYLID